MACGKDDGDGMNSQLKDALNEFMDRNSAAIEQAMENTNNAKDEPLIQDLVNYLSDSKDNQTVSMEDRSSVQRSLNCETNLGLTQQLGHFKPSMLKSTSEDTQNNVGHICGSESDTSLSADTSLHLLMQDREHPQYQHESYGQNISLIPYSVNQGNCPDSIPDGNLSSSTFNRPRDHHSGEVSSLLAARDTQYDRSEDPLQLHFATDASRQYSHTQSAQFPSMENDTGQFQNVPQMCSNGFMDSSVLSSSSFTTPPSSQMPHSTTHNGHGYGLMDVTLTSVSNMDADGSQVKLPEKMQMDEPEVVCQQSDVPTNDGQYHAAQNQTLDQHFQGYSSGSFNLLTTLDNAQDSAHSKFLNGCDFEQNLTTAESNSSAGSNGASIVTTHITTAFDLSVNTCESSLSSQVNTCESSLSGPFTSQNFQENMTELTPSSVQASVADFQGQTSPGQVNSVNSDTTNSTHYSDIAEYSVSPSPSAGCYSHNSNYLSPYQSNQYQDSPAHGHSSPNIADALRISIMNSTSPVAGLSPNHQLYQNSNSDSPSYKGPESSHQFSPVNRDQYQQNSPAGSTYASGATVVHSLDQHVMTYQGNPVSSMNISAAFPETATAVVLNQQHLYVNSSSAQANESSFFLNCTSDTTDLVLLNKIHSTQDMSEYTSSDSSNPVKSLADCNNTSADVTMKELSVEGQIHSFSHLDFQSMVNRFDAQRDASTTPQNNCNGISSLMFSQAPNLVEETTSHLSLNHQDQSVEIMAPYEPNSSIATMAAGQCGGQHTESHFGSSTFDLPATSQMADLHFSSQMSMKNFPQPMQVQDSEFLNHSSVAREKTNMNIETSMDTSSDLREHRDGVSHRISFEEIHMSIVNAGHRLSQELCGTNIEQTMFCKTTHSLVEEAKPAGCFSDVPSLRDLQTFHMEAAKIDGTLCSSNVNSDDPGLQSATRISESSPMQSSENVTFSGSFNSDSKTTYMLTSSSSFPNLNADHNLLANMLHSSQAPVESHQLQPENLITNQPTTVPNFLQNPLSGNSANSKDNQNLMSSKNSSENLQQFVGTTPSATQFNSGTAVLSSDSQLSGTTSMGSHGAAVNLLQYLSSLSQSRSAFVDKTIKNGTNPQSSQDSSTMSRNLTETTICNTAPSSETSLQSGSFVKANKTSTYSNTLKDTVVLEADAGHGSSGSLNGKISFGMSAGHSSTKETADPGAADASNNQPHIVMSLEDLQQLILEQKSHSSSPVLHHLSHGAASSPQPLVLQKHASHSLRHTQPRLMVRGLPLSSSTRPMNPHQQVLHSREGTQFLQDKTQQSEHISETETTPQRHPELTVTFTDQEHQQKLNSHSFHIPVVGQKDQQQAHTQSMEQYSQPKPIQQPSQLKPIEQQSQPKPMEQQTQYTIPQQLKQTDYQQQQQWTINGFPKENQNPNDNNSASLQHLILSHSHHPAQTDQTYIHTDQTFVQSEPTQHIHNVIQPLLKQEEQKQLPKQDKEQQLNGHQMRSFFLQFKDHLQSTEQPERHDRPCNESLKSEYRHLHSLLVGSETAAVLSQAANIIAKDQQSSETKNSDVDMDSTIFQSELTLSTSMLKVEDPNPINSESHAAMDGSSNRQTSLLAQILTERKRCHSPLSVSLHHSPAHSDSEDASPLSSPTFDDGNTQLTLIERSAGLQIKSDHHHSTDDGNEGDDDENAIFDLHAFHKRPSADELHTTRDNNISVPMKIAKPSVDADAHTSINPPPSPDSKFDFGGAISSASNFSFAFGNKEGKKPGMFTFGSSGTALPTNDLQQYKDGSNPNRPSCSKPLAKAVAMRSAVPTQPVRPTSRRQKECSLKASYPGKVDGVELKILAQPEPQHRARYQTEGSRGAIKDESQQGYPIIKLCGYSQATKLQVYIGDEGVKAKPHGFYQACRVSGKNSTACVEQEIEGTVVLEVDLLPENNMTVKLDCIGILKLRNADVEGRIGPKRARDKKKTNTRARLVMRCSIEKSDGRQFFLQVASNPIVCTQPVGQPEISRMSLTECNVHGGDSLFIIGKNFRNKGTSVLFQTLDSTDDYVTWQAEAQIEQEYFQPTHLICKIPPFKDKTIKTLQEAQIVVSCAGKMSDPHSFIYKPVYHMVSPVKQEVLMETDPGVSARTLPFVSPEALHLNRMVQQTHAQSSANSLFQLPANTFPDMQTRTVKSPSATTFKGFRPAVLRNLTPPNKPDVSTLPVCLTAASSDLVSVLPPSPSSVSFASGPSKNSQARILSQPSQQSSVFGEKYECNGLVQRSSGQTVSGVVTNSATNKGMVPGNMNTQHSSPVQLALNKSHPLMSMVSATSAGHTVGHTDLLSTGAEPSISHKDLLSTVATSVPPSPFFLVVDPALFQSTTGGDKIQQLLLQILEAQSKLV